MFSEYLQQIKNYLKIYLINIQYSKVNSNKKLLKIIIFFRGNFVK